MCPLTTRTLKRINRQQITLAGPRYTPGQDPAAPNLSIAAVGMVINALGFTPAFSQHVAESRATLEKQLEREQGTLRRVAPKEVQDSAALVPLLGELEAATPTNAAPILASLSRSCTRAAKGLGQRQERLWDAQRKMAEGSEERRSAEAAAHSVLRILGVVRDVQVFVTSAEAEALTTNAVLVTGEGGSGKTHSLCDLVRERMKAGAPTLLYLAHALPRGTDPLQALAEEVGLPPSADRLLAALDKLGRRSNRRALLIVDGINEGVRPRWRRVLHRYCTAVRRYPHVGLVLSCRSPFDKEIVSGRASRSLVRIEHPGFSDVEFDAQLEFFTYYDIPLPQFPLLAPEFSNPLFLKVLCQSIRDLSKRRKTATLREVAAGQKGLTYLLERFVKRIGEQIEDDLRLPRHACWKVIKGDMVPDQSDLVGIAPAMARLHQDHLSRAACLAILAQYVDQSSTGRRARRLLERMVTDGLLLESIEWDTKTEVIRLPYERFSDHLIARHLLKGALRRGMSEGQVRRAFYKGRPLGKVFEVVAGGWSFAMPGIATAIMLEFPERMRRVLPTADRELLWHLPKERQAFRPVRDAFLEGLAWRAADSFSARTELILESFLAYDESRSECYEVLLGLACRVGHPYSAAWLRAHLVQLTMPKRDVTWTEFVRLADDTSALSRLIAWVERTPDRPIARDASAAAMTTLSLLLTTTDRRLRDRATYALYLLGLRQPSALFLVTEDFLSFNDPYVPERLLAASYGVAMAHWADPAGSDLRTCLPGFARRLATAMFVPAAPHATRHTLTRGYAQGIIELARHIAPTCIPRRLVRYVRPSFQHMRSPFRSTVDIPDETVEKARSAVQMDFDNYKIGALIPGRHNYDAKHPEYVEVRRQLFARIVDLGYQEELFKQADDMIMRSQWYRNEAGKTDRYGKKYSWIAYFEMYGQREDENRLPDWRAGERCPDADIDPSFPASPSSWRPRLSNPFAGSPAAPEAWIRSGRAPSHKGLLERGSVDGARGAWVLLDAFIQQQAPDGVRSVFSFIKAGLATPGLLRTMRREFVEAENPHRLIPDAADMLYAYAGEIPWSTRFTRRCEGGKPARQMVRAFERYVGSRWKGYRMELPISEYGWESHHSVLNRAGHLTFPAPALCSAFGLVNHRAATSLYDRNGRMAAIYRRWHDGNEWLASHVFYVRRDLLRRYLRDTGQVLVWTITGEREFTAEGIRQVEIDQAVRELPYAMRIFRTLAAPSWQTAHP